MDRQLHLLTGAYALNALEPGERESFEDAALDSEETLREVRSLSETAALLAEQTTPVTPPPRVKADLMAAIRQTPQLPAVRDDATTSGRGTASEGPAAESPATAEPEAPTDASAPAPGVLDLGSARARRRAPGSGTRNGTKYLAVAAAALLVTSGGLTGVVISQNHQQDQLQNQMTALDDSNEKMLRIFSSNDVKSASQSLDDGAQVTVTYSASAGLAALTADGLPTLPQDKGYELWLIGDDGAAPMGMLDFAGGSSDTALMEGKLSSATHVGITVEPAGGSPQPTTDPIVLQEL
ncbi:MULTISPECIES: anti-sigma factor [unclassified Arthrobacter]|uniref:anti-sigma factor n=1 Tax=unclassified Arthrobacter TaxID=235627 RepID=UPI002655C366|nr:anti-sigma factor [Micrococcaceae bacterium]MDN5879929.1 anti-sigma factor [Micrococcaceae bacterium]MDN5887362.1 anti-sigma factor [Micrococcaceae bacterium]